MAQNIDTGLMLRMEASLSKFEKQMAKATQVGTSTATNIEKRFDKMGSRMAVSSNKAASGLGKVVQIGGAGRFVLQNTAAQIGDMAVQMEMGTGASRILSQQLPQLFGGFGALGGVLGLVAPLLGTVAAVGIPLAAMFFTLGGETDKTGDKVKTFTDKLDAAQSALGRAEAAMVAASAGGIEDLRKKYGEVTVAVSELADALADIELRAAAADMKALFDPAIFNNFSSKLASELDSLGAAVVGATESEIKGLEDQLARLQEQLQTTLEVDPNGNNFTEMLTAQIGKLQENIALLKGDLDAAGDRVGQLGPGADVIGQYRALRTALSDALNAQNFAAAADAARDLKHLIVEVAGEGDAAADAVTRIEDMARQAANRFADAEGNANGVADASTRITNEVGNAADEAARLNGNLAGALAQLAGITKGIATANRLASQAAQRRIDFAGDPVGLAGAETRGQMQEDTGALAYAAIRNGSTSTLSQIESDTNSLAAGARAAAELEENAKAAEKAAADAIKAASGTGSKRSGGAKSKTSGGKEETPFFETLERDIQALERQIEMVGKSKAKIAELTARYALLDEAKKRGITVTDELSARIDQEAAQVGRLAGQYEAAQDKMAALEQLNQQWKDSLIDAAMGVEGAFDGVIDAIKRAAVEYALFGTGMLADIGGGGLGGNVFGGLIGGVGGGGGLGGVFGGARAAGGPVSGGKTYLVGERGPELFTPPGSGQIIPNNKLGGAGAGGGAMSINVNVTGANGDQHVIALVQEGVSRGLSAFDQQLPSRVKQISKDPRAS